MGGQYGLCQDEWLETEHFPPQMYVREGVRIIGDEVFDQQDWLAATSADSVGIGSWGLDIHVVHRYMNAAGLVENEGFTFPSTGEHAFELPFSLVLPRRNETVNLAVPVCLSCSHVTWAGLREEPTLWQLGAASGTAAAMAGPGGILRDVDMTRLQAAIQNQGCDIALPGKPSGAPAFTFKAEQLPHRISPKGHVMFTTPAGMAAGLSAMALVMAVMARTMSYLRRPRTEVFQRRPLEQNDELLQTGRLLVTDTEP